MISHVPSMSKCRVIFLPGILQSSLGKVDPSGHLRVVWDGDLRTQLGTFLTEPQVLHAFTRLKPIDIIEQITLGPLVVQDIYKSLFDFFKTSLAFVEGETFFRFPYDWRQSVFTEGKRLVSFIDDLPAGDEIVLIGHSLGSLVARVAVMEAPDKLIAKKLTKVIELAPVHLGSSRALQRLLDVFGLTTLRRILGRYVPFVVPVFEGLILGLTRSMPSVWQLSPHAREKVLARAHPPHGSLSALDWPGWAEAVERMVKQEVEKFQQLVDNIGHGWPPAVKVSVVYSSSHRTPYSFTFDPVPPYDIDTNHPLKKVDGDYVVWEWSALLHYTIKEKVKSYHRIIAGDSGTLSFLQKEIP